MVLNSILLGGVWFIIHLSIHVNHKTFQESKTLFFFNLKRRPLLFVEYDI
jgi:hypothetical protein